MTTNKDNFDGYKKRKGLEGPMRVGPYGKIYYWDPLDGHYWDPTTDIYMSDEEVMQILIEAATQA